jgi:hypothetical protein
MPNANEFVEAPWIVIPYWTGDLGVERPVLASPIVGNPTRVVGYACQSIKLISGTYDVPTTVTVTVGNYGRGSEIDAVNLELWWALRVDELPWDTMRPAMAQNVALLVRGSLSNPVPLTFTIPAPGYRPGFVNLLVRATTTNDTVPDINPANPYGDRHWASCTAPFL